MDAATVIKKLENRGKRLDREDQRGFASELRDAAEKIRNGAEPGEVIEALFFKAEHFSGWAGALYEKV